MIDSIRLGALVAQLDSNEPMERLDAVYKLGSGRDRRAIPHLIRVLKNHDESPMVRGQAAESLTMFRTRRRKVAMALVDSIADASAEVRFWCVFSLGQFVKKRKTPLPVIRALRARLTDTESPDDHGNWWPVGLEALAMLRGHKKSRFPIEQMFKETILSVMRNPLDYRDQWRWADCYWDDGIAGSEIEGRALYDAALQKITEAGFEPVRFGQQERQV
jgi:hypothetical protein